MTLSIDTDACRTTAAGLTMLAWNPTDTATLVRDVVRRTDLLIEAGDLADALDEMASATIRLSDLHRSTADAADGADTFAGAATGDGSAPFALAGGSAPGADGPNGSSGVIRDFLLGDLGNLWNGGDDGLPTGQLVAASLRISRTIGWIADAERSADTIPLFTNGGIGIRLSKALQRSSRLAPVGRWMQSPAGATAFRTLGIAGGVVGTATGTWELIQHGDPRDAYREHGAGYVADVAGTAFSASTTAFLIAPNPVTAGAVVVTGVVWVGAEVWDHREEIADWTSEQWDRTTGAVSDAWDTGTDALSDAGDFIGDTASTAWDAGTDAVGAVGSALDPRSWF